MLIQSSLITITSRAKVRSNIADVNKRAISDINRQKSGYITNGLGIPAVFDLKGFAHQKVGAAGADPMELQVDLASQTE